MKPAAEISSLLQISADLILSSMWLNNGSTVLLSSENSNAYVNCRRTKYELGCGGWWIVLILADRQLQNAPSSVMKRVEEDIKYTPAA